MEEQINICVTCLSTDRRLVPVHKITGLLREIHFEELQVSPGGVCWECRSILLKYYSFKNRAKTAQETLTHTRKHKNIKSLTTLSRTNILLDNTYDFVSNTNCDTKLEVDPDAIKEENRDLSDNCTDEVDEYLDNIDDNLDNIDDNLDNVDEIDESLVKVDDNLDDDTLGINENPVKKLGNIYSVIKNNYDDNLIREQENFSQNGNNGIFDETNEKLNVITKNFEIKEPKSNINLPTRTVNRHEKDGVRVTKKISTKIRDIDDKEFHEKFVQVVLCKEEMVAVREEKRNHPSFKKLPHICHSCVLGFRKEDKYRSHMKKKHDERIGSLICEVCSIRFPHKLALNKHKRKHYVVYRCRLCKYQGNDLRSAVNHCKIKHAADKPDSIHCSRCYFVGKNQQDLEEHMEMEHQFWCNECGEKFKFKRNIIIHIARTHTSKRAFRCDICKKGFKTKTHLESHLARHNENIAKKLSYCQECDIQFKNMGIYRTHLKSTANHSEGYTCTECNKIFTAKSYLKLHYNFYHLNLSQYKCGICSKTFITKWRLKNHQSAHLDTDRPRKYSCNICSKKFFNSAVLRSHQHIHSDERTFMCEDCGDTFKQSACLYSHTRLKHRDGGRKRKRPARLRDLSATVGPQ